MLYLRTYCLRGWLKCVVGRYCCKYTLLKGVAKCVVPKNILFKGLA